MKKNLSILINSLSGGGAERVVSILLKELQDEYDITLVLMNDTIVYEVPSSVRLVYLENADAKESDILKVLKLPLLGWRYSKLCQSLHVDVSLSFTYRPNFINVLAKLFGLKAKCIISERSTPSMTYNNNAIGRVLVRWLYPKADLVVPNSKGSAQDLVENFSLDPQKVQVIQNPIDMNKIINLGLEKVEDVSFEKKFTFISVGRLEKVKNHDITIRAFVKVADRDSQLFILGIGEQKESLQSLIDEMGVGQKVKLLGFVKNPYKYIAKSDCFVLSSSREGFPNALVEALACGVPVISSDCKSGPREILAPRSEISLKLKDTMEVAQYGILYPVDDDELLCRAMEKIMQDKDLYSKYKSSVKSRARDFEVDAVINRYKKVID